MQKYTFTFLFLLSTLLFPVSGQNKVIELEIEGKVYDNLFVRASRPNKTATSFDGRYASGGKWIFEIPDSIARETRYFEFGYKQKDDQIEDLRRLSFGDIALNNEDAVRSEFIHFNPGNDLTR